MDEISEASFTTRYLYGNIKIEDEKFSFLCGNESGESEEEFDESGHDNDIKIEPKEEEEADSYTEATLDETFELDEDDVNEVQDPMQTESSESKRVKHYIHRSQWSNLDKDEDKSINMHYLGPEIPFSVNILTPIEYFKQLITDELIDLIVHETNKYSIEKNKNKPVNVTNKEMEQWLGLICYFSMSKLPNTTMHWSRKLYPNCDIAGDTMGRDRFEAIKSNFHLVDNNLSNESKADKFCKVRPMINHLRANFQAIPMIQNLCIDEQIVLMKGKSSVKQYIPSKPKTWGFKIFVLADNKGMIYDFIPYAGRIEPVDDPAVPDLKPRANSVLHLAQSIPSNRNHLLFFDDWFTSLPLIDHLARRGIWCCGTIRCSRLAGLPTELKCQKTITKRKRGAIETVKVKQENSVGVYIKWYNDDVINLISTFAKVRPMEKVLYFDTKKKHVVKVECPDIVRQYNKSMEGVDLAEQLISLYKIPIKTKKYYMRLVYHMIDMTVVNAWLLYRRHASSLKLQRKDIQSLAEFKILLAFDLMKSGKLGIRNIASSKTEARKLPKKGSNYPSLSIQKDGVGHIPAIGEKRNRCKRNKCSGRTNIFCKKCKVCLCLNSKSNCFAFFHE